MLLAIVYSHLNVWCRGYCTSIRDTAHRAGGNDDHAGLGCDKFLTEEMSQVVLGYLEGQFILLEGPVHGQFRGLTQVVHDVRLAPL